MSDESISAWCFTCATCGDKHIIPYRSLFYKDSDRKKEFLRVPCALNKHVSNVYAREDFEHWEGLQLGEYILNVVWPIEEVK